MVEPKSQMTIFFCDFCYTGYWNSCTLTRIVSDQLQPWEQMDLLCMTQVMYGTFCAIGLVCCAQAHECALRSLVHPT